MLEVDPAATPEELKRAWRKAALRWHPDRNPDPGAAEQFRRVSQAWEIVGDPQRRRQHDAHRAAPAGGGVPADFVDAVADAVERAQRWNEEVVVPHFASLFRGRGAEMGARWVRAIRGAPPVPGRFEAAITSGGRRRARKWLDGVTVGFTRDPFEATSLRLFSDGTSRIGVSPAALWQAGFRADGATELDDAVMQLLCMRYAVALSAGRFAPPPGDSAADWDAAVTAARAADAREQRTVWTWRAIWAGVAALIAFMLASGWNSW
ncbi:MAG: DnaJ domain-containing protein [Myxococcota bacterium]